MGLRSWNDRKVTAALSNPNFQSFPGFQRGQGGIIRTREPYYYNNVRPGEMEEMTFPGFGKEHACQAKFLRLIGNRGALRGPGALWVQGVFPAHFIRVAAVDIGCAQLSLSTWRASSWHAKGGEQCTLLSHHHEVNTLQVLYSLINSHCLSVRNASCSEPCEHTHDGCYLPQRTRNSRICVKIKVSEHVRGRRKEHPLI